MSQNYQSGFSSVTGRGVPGRPVHAQGPFIPQSDWYTVGTGGVSLGEAVKLDGNGHVVSLTGAAGEISVGVTINKQLENIESNIQTVRYAAGTTVEVAHYGAVWVSLGDSTDAAADPDRFQMLTPGPGGKWFPINFPYHGAPGLRVMATSSGKKGGLTGGMIMHPSLSYGSAAGDLDLTVDPNPVIIRGTSAGSLSAGYVVNLDASNKFAKSITDAVGVVLGHQNLAADQVIGVLVKGAVKVQLNAAQVAGDLLGFGSSNKWIAHASTHKFLGQAVQPGAANAIVTVQFSVLR